ncbi:hypothetical protein [Paremcibacter congregatus]|uniref:hypothetical protein n=1 Tax=Paremcibacter congregatus TaxID=2043170 RepID=UPI0030ED52E0|tara:strand:+ start:137 stop:523 length:387 start_codon:yes stop_codon:yes gene_type:complete
MTEELPKTSGFLKFIVIFMGILIVVGLAVVVWKVMDLAKKKAAREKLEAAQKERLLTAQERGALPAEPFSFDLNLESGEEILESSSAAAGLWVRIGRDGVTQRIILVDYSGKVIGSIQVKHNDAAHSL